MTTGKTVALTKWILVGKVMSLLLFLVFFFLITILVGMKQYLIVVLIYTSLMTIPGCSLERLMLRLKLQYFGHLMRRVDSLKKTDAGRDWGQEEKGMTEDEMAGWHHQLDVHEFG